MGALATLWLRGSKPRWKEDRGRFPGKSPWAAEPNLSLTEGAQGGEPQCDSARAASRRPERLEVPWGAFSVRERRTFTRDVVSM
jgi:hypothetical protein